MKVMFKRATAGQWLVALMFCHLLVAGCAQRYGQLYAERSEQAWLKPADKVVSSKKVYTQTQEPYSGVVKTRLTGHLQDPSIGELSGLAASRRHDDTYWAINDSGNPAELFALNSNGASLGVYRLPVPNHDWEDMATYELDGVAWIAIADVGDNLRRRKTHQIHFILEPSLPDASALSAATELEIEHTITFSYEDGAQNVEAFAVSVNERKIFLVAKKSVAPAVYSLPLETGGGAGDLPVRIATREASLYSLGATREDSTFEILLGSKILLAPTGMDISADGRFAVVANYRHVYLFRRAPLEPWAQALARKPQVITSHRLAQSEAVTFSADAAMVLIGSEGRRSPLLRVDAQEAPAEAVVALASE